MNLFRKRYTPNNEDLAKNQNEIKFLEANMRGIFKAFEAYIPSYQNIAQINRALIADVTKFYERYPAFKELGEQLLGTFRVQSESIDSLLKVLVSVRSQYAAWFLNFDVIKDLWKKYDTTEQNFLHYDDKMNKMKSKTGSKLSQIDETEKKLNEAKNVYDSVTLELTQLNDKILHLSYTVVNSTLAEFLATKAKYYQDLNEQYKIYHDVPTRMIQKEKEYLASLEEESSESPEKLKAVVNAVVVRNKLLKVQHNLGQDTEGGKFNPFQELERKNRLAEMFKEYKNNYSYDVVS